MRRLLLVVGAVAFWAACHDAAAPLGPRPSAATVAAAPVAITLDQQSSVLNDGTAWSGGGTHVGKDFGATNPHLGDAIVATFFWRGTTNTITTVSDHLCDANGTPVGNSYTLVDYVTAGGYSMATYVATNVQGYPDPATNPDQRLCVHALFSNAITEGGMIISAYQGVSTTAALGAYHSAAGSGSTTTVADPGAITVAAGAMAYGVTMADTVVGTDPPPGFTNVTDVGDSAIKADAEYEVLRDGGTADARWNWYFTSPHAWLATALALNPATPAYHFAFAVQPSTTLPEMRITPAVRVNVVDGAGNVVSDFTGTVTIAIGRNGGMLMPGTLSGTKTVTAVNGVATFANLSIDELGNGYTLVVTAGGITGAESAPFNIGAF
jgi:hypothetical protein